MSSRFRAVVAVCTYDRGDLANLDALAAHVPDDVEVIIVDASTIPSRVQENRRRIEACGFRHVLASPHGLASQRNRAGLECRAPILVFLDDDCFPSKGWLDGLLTSVEQGADVATARVVTPPDLAGPFDRAFNQDRGSRSRTFTRKDLRAIPPLRFALRPQGGDASIAPWACGTGSSFAVRWSTFRRLGGFRKDLGPGTPAMQGEDVDFFLRVLASRGTVRYEADAIVEHRHLRRDPDEFLHTAYTYSRGARAVLMRNLRTKPAYLLVLVARPLQLALLGLKSRASGDSATAAMCASALRGWFTLPPLRTRMDANASAGGRQTSTG